MRKSFKNIVIDALLWSVSISLVCGMSLWAYNRVVAANTDTWVAPTTLVME